MTDTSYRVVLSSDVVPTCYDLTLEPDLERFTFTGFVKIKCDFNVATDEVTVHQKQLLISEAIFKPVDGGKAIPASEITSKVKDMTATFSFSEVLPVGKGILEIKFGGVLNDQMAGFYRSKYKDTKGIERHMACTQFEAIDARRCFPCWDEPGRKAVFVVTLVYPATLVALSNMPMAQSEVQADGRKRETFAPTPKMSTYLLAFVIGELTCISGTTKNDVDIRVFACPGSLEKCGFALKCAVRSLEFFDDFFNMRYPLPKLDMVAIPDFSAGAMENWGLVTYRESCLLCDEQTVSSAQKVRICSVVAHELSHQWFGNLVTMGWWDDLWLNEGFANFMETYATDKLFPEWRMWESYVSSEQQNALKLDAMRSSHPIQVPIKRAEQVEEVFDAISYCKGGSVIRMIFAVLGQDKFQEGLRKYFQKHQYGNTETSHLWSAWAEVSGKPIDRMMGSWTLEMGFPVLKILADPWEAGGEVSEVEVEQSWFLADGSVEAGDAEKSWFVPVIMGTDKGEIPVVFIEPENKVQKVVCGFLKDAAWLKLNFGQHVPARVLYPSSMLGRLVSSMKTLPPEDRIGLLSDSYALTKAGAMEPMQLVGLLNGFHGELNDKVWSELSAVLGGLRKVVQQGLDEATVAAFVEFAARLITPAFEEVGWETRSSDDDNLKMLRSIILGLVSSYCFKDPVVISEAQRRCEAFLASPSDPSVLSADTRLAVLTLTVKSSTTLDIFDRLAKAHDDVTDAAIKCHIYQALSAAPTPEMRSRVLEWALSESVRAQDLIYFARAMPMTSKSGADAMFEWVKADYSKIYARLGETSMLLFMNVVKGSGSGFVTAERAAEVEEFWKAQAVYFVVEKAVAQTVEDIKSNAVFVDRLRSSEVSKSTAWEPEGNQLLG
eukprot:TRINITY_DN20438_c0_g2_i2.p1 TRINITY_DN20438_c0_g2~~TRINITY_DN20438_c0_g2_i2.p1  ORF type:complete len:890 (-),score=180.27 TRINITY_DN20438_c0_g2_i2:203-2872(-)